MSLSLSDVAKVYLADSNFQDKRQALVEKRNASLPMLQNLTLSFIRETIDFDSFRAQLEQILRVKGEWGAAGFGFMMELHKLGKYYRTSDNMAEITLRGLLTELNAVNVGQRIERFYQFLLAERKRLHTEVKSSNMLVAPGNSAFIISLFAYWLDPAGAPIIYYDTMRKGLYILVKSNLLFKPSELRPGVKAIEVTSEKEHKSCVALVNEINRQAPEVNTGPLWAEYFCQWVTQNFQSLTEAGSTLIKETDNADLLAAAPTAPARSDSAAGVRETYTLAAPTPSSEKVSDRMPGETAHYIPHEPLQAVSEPQLTQLIRRVQSHILVDEAIIRRIYHALLAGHVILTGPPGTGKTELARLIPEILWSSPLNATSGDAGDDAVTWDSQSAYTTSLVTATDEWSVRTLISGIAPQSRDGQVSYKVQYGHLTSAILKNWSFQGSQPEEWSITTLRRKRVSAYGALDRSVQQEFRGLWLVIDEFNRAPIDLALGDALTALGGSDVLRVAIEGGSAQLPIPQDFRVIGTLNSFDRHYLNQISEALKRRFSFVEILPPTRRQREAEQGIVLYKALSSIAHLSKTIEISDRTVYWYGGAAIEPDANGIYAITWLDEQASFREAFETAWQIFEVIRIYRQLGTAQAIALLRHMLIAGILQGHSTREAWIEQALDAALCDTIADQLQVLLPDEIETLLLYLTTGHTGFSAAYHKLLADLAAANPPRLHGQMLALSSVISPEGQPFLSDAQVEEIINQDAPVVPPQTLTALFHLDARDFRLPQFARRLRTFKVERGL